MANMAYCRFQNTLGDVQDCQDHMDDDDLSQGETKARETLIRICADIACDYGDEDD